MKLNAATVSVLIALLSTGAVIVARFNSLEEAKEIGVSRHRELRTELQTVRERVRKLETDRDLAQRISELSERVAALQAEVRALRSEPRRRR